MIIVWNNGEGGYDGSIGFYEVGDMEPCIFTELMRRDYRRGFVMGLAPAISWTREGAESGYVCKLDHAVFHLGELEQLSDNALSVIEVYVRMNNPLIPKIEREWERRANVPATGVEQS